MRRRSVQFATIVLLVGMAGVFAQWKYGWTLDDLRRLAAVPVGEGRSPLQRTVSPGESIADAMRDAPPGSEIVVEPGEYREQVTLKAGVRLVSRVPGGATSGSRRQCRTRRRCPLFWPGTSPTPSS